MSLCFFQLYCGAWTICVWQFVTYSLGTGASFSHEYSRWDMKLTTLPYAVMTCRQTTPGFDSLSISLISTYFICWSLSEKTVKYKCKDTAIPLTHFSFSPSISQANNRTGISCHFWCQYMPNQHKRNSNMVLYMQPRKHTAFTRYCNVTQTILYHSALTG